MGLTGIVGNEELHPTKSSKTDRWVANCLSSALTDEANYIKPIKELQALVASSSELSRSTEAMFVEAHAFSPVTPIGGPSVKSWQEFLGLLNIIMTNAPQFYLDEQGDAAELVGFPINTLLNWPMGTHAGYETFSSKPFNQQMKKVLNHWGAYLTTDASRHVLAHGEPNGTPPTIAWLSKEAKRQMVSVASQPFGDCTACLETPFEEIFEVPDPNDPVYLGYRSWDQFFTRDFHQTVRPVGDATLVNACESAPLQYVRNIQYTDEFHLKGQAYSLEAMLNFDPLARQFDGGSVYQGFLSALSYHRWNSPVDGTITKTFIVDGSYYLQNRFRGIKSTEPDPTAPNGSQPFISSVATRAVIFIQADDPAIGLMAFVAVGMAEVSSCEITVLEGQNVRKGDPLGMFHFGGSTHCLVFRPEVSLDFQIPVSDQPDFSTSNVAVKSNLANPS